MDNLFELLVETDNPRALDQTINSFGGMVGQSPDGKYIRHVDGYYTVRSVSGDVSFLEFAIKKQGYARIVGKREI